ncbi:hypothetical protein A2Z23_00920 [Candidatus Curtissbacteria bacterium RBG_16_39_7]|uniref:Methyltransferase type 11 domain-containing protein n=1 Tax=Candidatus Curtissbacteria bacterium RBG_16_39_7 TaxID=1797707 RepID=A0A1F5G1W3_9BACT|nr:MAG: hypothetical protein A2Z23_00920 [Candidatus Curtissbacteria bacterium RBG_16_39_7]
MDEEVDKKITPTYLNPKNSFWATPRKVTDLKYCNFYHTMDIPGYGCVKGQWDLRRGIRKYLGGIEFKGKRVLDIGTASGFVCFYMENQGAEVVGCDLSEKQAWDMVPYANYNYKQLVAQRQNHIKKINNSFWLAHRAYKSRAKMVYTTVYEIPERLGMFDVTTLGCILVHLRDPFLALQKALKLTKEMVIITEPLYITNYPLTQIFGIFFPQMSFLPNPKVKIPSDSWWVLSPQIIKRFIGVLGFEKTKINYHIQYWFGQKRLLFTIVGYRTKE